MPGLYLGVAHSCGQDLVHSSLIAPLLVTLSLSSVHIITLSITRLLQRGCSSLRLLHLSGVSPLFSDTFLCSLVTPTRGQYHPYHIYHLFICYNTQGGRHSAT